MNYGITSESPARQEREKIDATPSEIAERECVRRMTILECPICNSHRAAILNTRPIRARCVDCDTTYAIHTEQPQDQEEEEEQPEPKKPKQRKTKADYRAEIESATPPPAGFNTTLLEEALAAGPAGIRQAQKIALKY